MSREELVEQGTPPQAANVRIVQQNMEDTIAIHCSVWICLFMVILCLLFPLQLALFMWLAISYVAEGEKCDGPLRLWAMVVFSITLFNVTCNRKSQCGSCAHRVFCCFSQNPDQPRPQPCRVWTFDFLARILLPFVWSCMGIHWMRADAKAEAPCEASSHNFYLASKVYSVFVLAFTLWFFISMIGLATLLRFIMRHGLLHSTNAASPSVIEACKVVQLKEIDLDENPSCCICTEDYCDTHPIVLTGCGHSFHKTCLGNWLKMERTCPLCRKDLSKTTDFDGPAIPHAG